MTQPQRERMLELIEEKQEENKDLRMGIIAMMIVIAVQILLAALVVYIALK